LSGTGKPRVLVRALNRAQKQAPPQTAQGQEPEHELAGSAAGTLLRRTRRASISLALRGMTGVRLRTSSVQHEHECPFGPDQRLQRGTAVAVQSAGGPGVLPGVRVTAREPAASRQHCDYNPWPNQGSCMQAHGSELIQVTVLGRPGLPDPLGGEPEGRGGASGGGSATNVGRHLSDVQVVTERVRNGRNLGRHHLDPAAGPCGQKSATKKRALNSANGRRRLGRWPNL